MAEEQALLADEWVDGLAEFTEPFKGEWDFETDGPPTPCICGGKDFAPHDDYGGLIWVCQVCGVWVQELGTRNGH